MIIWRLGDFKWRPKGRGIVGDVVRGADDDVLVIFRRRARAICAVRLRGV
jgi:hypothetical protein